MKKWLYSINGIVHEPVSEAKIVDMVLRGILEPDSTLQDPNSLQWVHIRDIPNIMDTVHKPTLNLKFHEPTVEQILAGDDGEPIFYHVSTRTFMILMIVTFGLYTIYWIYANWQYIFKARAGKRGKEGNRSALNYMFVGDLLHKIRSDKTMMATALNPFDPHRIAFKVYMLMLITLVPPFINYPKVLSIMYLLVPLFVGAGYGYILLPVQQSICKVNKQLNRAYSSETLVFYIVLVWAIVVWFRIISTL